MKPTIKCTIDTKLVLCCLVPQPEACPRLPNNCGKNVELLHNYFSLLIPGQATLLKEPTVQIQCLSGSMLITIKNAPASYDGLFSGMVYPKGLAKNSTCLSEYRLVLHKVVHNALTQQIVHFISFQGSQRPHQIQTSTSKL